MMYIRTPTLLHLDVVDLSADRDLQAPDLGYEALWTLVSLVADQDDTGSHYGVERRKLHFCIINNARLPSSLLSHHSPSICNGSGRGFPRHRARRGLAPEVRLSIDCRIHRARYFLRAKTFSTIYGLVEATKASGRVNVSSSHNLETLEWIASMSVTCLLYRNRHQLDESPPPYGRAAFKSQRALMARKIALSDGASALLLPYRSTSRRICLSSSTMPSDACPLASQSLA